MDTHLLHALASTARPEAFEMLKALTMMENVNNVTETGETTLYRACLCGSTSPCHSCCEWGQTLISARSRRTVLTVAQSRGRLPTWLNCPKRQKEQERDIFLDSSHGYLARLAARLGKMNLKRPGHPASPSLTNPE